jgi:hypothetical protein
MYRIWGKNGFINWWSLRPVGNLFILKVSYPALILIPFISKYEEFAKLIGLYNWIILASFFGSLSLALANLLYDIFCPVLVKKFDSPNTLYKEMLHIKLDSLKCYPHDNFDATIDHCKDAYNGFSESKPVLGMACAMLYFFYLILFGLIFVDRVLVVVKSIFS